MLYQLSPLLFLFFTSGTWFIASFPAHGHAQSLPSWSNKENIDGEIRLAFENDRKPYQKPPNAGSQTHKCSGSIFVQHYSCWNENFLLPSKLERWFWNILWGFMNVRDLRIWALWSPRNCQWICWEEHSSIRKTKWDIGLIFFFFLGLENMPSMPDIIAETDGMADAVKEKWLTTRWTIKNKQEGQRKKHTSSPLSSATSSQSCKMSNCSPQGCRLQMKCLTPFSNDCTFEIYSHSWEDSLFVHGLSKEERKATTNLIHDVNILWRQTANLFLAQLFAIWYVETGWNSCWFILEMFQLTSFHSVNQMNGVGILINLN